MVNDLTIQNIRKHREKFSEDLYHTIEFLIDFSVNQSPMSDIYFISSKLNKELVGFEKSNTKTWTPVRNVLRLIAKIADDELDDEKIVKIKIDDMLCGCDYFEGIAYYITDTETVRGGKYKWKWTAFPGHELHYNKFTNYSNEVVNLKLVV